MLVNLDNCLNPFQEVLASNVCHSNFDNIISSVDFQFEVSVGVEGLEEELVSACLELACFVYFGASVAFEFSDFDAEWIAVDSVFVWDALEGKVKVDDVMPRDDRVWLSVAFQYFFR